MADEAHCVDLEAILQKLEGEYTQKRQKVAEPAPEAPFCGFVDGQAQGAFEKAVRLVHDAVEGSGHDTLNAQAFTVAGIAKAGRLDWSVCRESLLNAVWSWEKRPGPRKGIDHWGRTPEGVIDAAYDDAEPMPFIDLEGQTRQTIREPKRDNLAVPGLADIDTDWWNSHPALQGIYSYALAMGLAPWGVLASVLAYVGYFIPPNVDLPRFFGGSLNTLWALCGPPQCGKDAALKEAQQVIPAAAAIPHEGAGSGEGLHEVFWEYRQEDDDSGPVKSRIPAAFLHWSEAGLVAKLNQRRGQTLLENIRLGFNGSRLGALNRKKSNDFDPVEAGSYRLSLVANMQASTATMFIDAAAQDGGTTRRIFFAPCVDTRRVKEAIDWQRLAPVWIPPVIPQHGQITIGLPKIAFDDLQRAMTHEGMMQEGNSSFDLRGKLAVLLAALLEPERFDCSVASGNRVIQLTAEDWQRTEVPIKVSLATLDWLLMKNQEVITKAKAAEVEARQAVDEHIADKRNNLASHILKAVRELTGGDKTVKVKRADFQVMSPMNRAAPAEINKALAILASNGLLVREPIDSVIGQRGQRWMLGPSA